MISRVLLFATGMVVSGFGILPMCDLCARTGGSFNPGAIAGHDADTGEYTCQVALETLDHIYGDAPPKHHCFIAQTWYAESCCDGSVIPNRSPAITGAPCDICGGDGSLAPTTAWSTCAWDESTASPARDRQGESFLGYASSPTNCMDKASAAGCDIAQLPASGYGTCWCRWDTNSTEQSVPIDPWMNHYVPHRACHLANDVPADYVPADSVPAGTFNPSAVAFQSWGGVNKTCGWRTLQALDPVDSCPFMQKYGSGPECCFGASIPLPYCDLCGGSNGSFIPDAVIATHKTLSANYTVECQYFAELMQLGSAPFDCVTGQAYFGSECCA